MPSIRLIPLLVAIISGAVLAGAAMARVGEQLDAQPPVNPAAAPMPIDAPFGEPVPTTPSSCPLPAPTTSADFTRMFAGLDPREWGAADIALSTPLGDGRNLWLFGDTFRSGARTLAHSTAIVQDGSCLHVVNGGGQLLPNDDPNHIYWISSAHVVNPFTGVRRLDQHTDAVVVVTARRIRLTGSGAWCFADDGITRQAILSVRYDTGDAEFLGWDPGADLANRTPAPKPISPMVVLGPHHFTYEHRVHAEITLADGHHLVTDCQNWDDGVLHPFADYRPIFSETL